MQGKSKQECYLVTTCDQSKKIFLVVVGGDFGEDIKVFERKKKKKKEEQKKKEEEQKKKEEDGRK